MTDGEAARGGMAVGPATGPDVTPGGVAAAHRLTLVAHGPTTAASRLVLGDRGPLLRPAPRRADAVATDRVCSGPEPACVATVAGWGLVADVVPGLAAPDLGRWEGCTLAEVAATEPAGFAQWLTDPEARPHDGETLVELVGRVRQEVTGRDWSGGRSVWVVTPLVARAVTVAALAAPPALVLALDASYGGEIQLSRHAGRWRLQGLSRVPGG